jgi:hypothetical protein
LEAPNSTKKIYNTKKKLQGQIFHPRQQDTQE